ncbi:hypothetical protein Vi05172_g11451 [Venturia inaequalis]|nr:hypothetical protein Vi05172_g11451 [Venturia inaequalis]
MLVYFDGLNELYILKGNYLVAGRAINNSEIGHGYGWLHRSVALSKEEEPDRNVV